MLRMGSKCAKGFDDQNDVLDENPGNRDFDYCLSPRLDVNKISLHFQSWALPVFFNFFNNKN